MLVLSVPEYELAGPSGSTADDSNRWPGAQRVAWCSAPDGEEGPCCCWQWPTCLNYLHYHYLTAHLFELSALSLSDGPPVCTICSVHPLLHHCWPTCLNYPQKQQAGDLVAVDMEEIANRRQSGSGTLLCNISVIWATNS